MLNTSARAEVNCLPIIQAADAAIAARDTTIKDLKLGLTNCGQDTKALEIKVGERDAQLASIFRNPWIMLGVGFVAGAVLLRR